MGKGKKKTYDSISIEFSNPIKPTTIDNAFSSNKERLTLFKQRAIKTLEMRDALRYSDSIINFVSNYGGIKIIKKPTWKKNNPVLWSQLQSDIYTWILLMQYQKMQFENKSWSLIFYEYMQAGNTVKCDSLSYKSVPLYHDLLSVTMPMLPSELYVHAEELCTFYRNHKIDPYGCILGQKPSKKILDECLKVSPSVEDLHSPFSSLERANNDKLSSIKDVKQKKYHTLLSKIINWSRLKPKSLILAVKQTASLILGVNQLKTGEIVLLNLDDEWVYARVAREPKESSSILIYLTPDESQISTFGIDKVLPISSNIIQEYFTVEDCYKLLKVVQNNLDNIYHSILSVCKQKATEYLQENGIDIEVLQLATKGQFTLAHEEKLQLMDELLQKPIPKDKIEQAVELIKEIIIKSIEKLNNAPKFSIFPMSLKSDIKELQNFNCEKSFLQEFKHFSGVSKLGLINLSLMKKEILSGKTKKEIVDDWLRKIKIKVAEYLEQFGFKKDQLPRNYLDEMPYDISSVRSNQVILHRIIESYRLGIDHFKLQELIDRLCANTYCTVDLFISNTNCCVASFLKCSSTKLPSTNKELLSLIESSDLEQSIKLKLSNTVKDKEYLENMKRMETDAEFAKQKYMTIVPISGLIVSELCRLENEHLTSLSVWDPALINKHLNPDNSSPLEKAIINDKLSEVKKILSSGSVYVNELDTCGLTPLHISCSFMNNKPRLSIVDYLLDYAETDISASNNTGNTAFHFFVRITVESSIQNQYRDILLKFIQKSPNLLHIQNHLGETPLHLAILFSNLTTVRLLLENGADSNYAAESGNTPLHYAVNIGNIECVSIILRYHGNHTLRNKKNETPSDIAFKLKHINVLQLLLQTDWNEDKIQKANKQAQHRLSHKPQRSQTQAALTIPNNILNLTKKKHPKQEIFQTISPKHMNIYWEQTDKTETIKTENNNAESFCTTNDENKSETILDNSPKITVRNDAKVRISKSNTHRASWTSAKTSNNKTKPKIIFSTVKTKRTNSVYESVCVDD